MSTSLLAEHDWKRRAILAPEGHYVLDTPDLNGVPVRLFLTQALLTEAEPALYRQIVNATRFPGVKLVALTPDAHFGYGVPVGCVILTDRNEGAVAMGPVGFDIGCGMMSARSEVPAEMATPDRKLAFHREVMNRVHMGAGGKSVRFGCLRESELEEIVRGGAEGYVEKHGARFDRESAERHRIPVDDDWDSPWGGPGGPSAGWSSWARSAGETTSSSCSAPRRRARSSCRSTRAAAASAMGSRRTTSRWQRTRTPT